MKDKLNTSAVLRSQSVTLSSEESGQSFTPLHLWDSGIQRPEDTHRNSLVEHM